MKLLKEIGTLIKPEFESMTQFEPFIQMSLEERRELVRAVIRLTIKELTGKTPSDERVEYEYNIICKEQGL